MTQTPTRRQFLARSSAALAAGTLAATLPRNVHAAGDDTIRVGLVGCGGRGTGAAAQALTADPGAKLIAMANSTMMAVIARMSAYTGKVLTWEKALNSTEDLSPPKYDWDGPLPEPPVAMPGLTA